MVKRPKYFEPKKAPLKAARRIYLDEEALRQWQRGTFTMVNWLTKTKRVESPVVVGDDGGE